MANIFLERSQYVPPIKRNSFDKSKLVNGTFRCGYLYPIDWEEVSFGDSLRTNIRAAIRTMPMVWPIQTPIICKFYQFYVRYRTLMKNFTDFRFGNKEIIHPYISLPGDADFWKTGQLGDWLGVPTTYASSSRLVYNDLVQPTQITGTVPKSFLPIYKITSSPSGSFISASFSYDTPQEGNYGIARFFSLPSNYTLIKDFRFKNVFNSEALNTFFYIQFYRIDNGYILGASSKLSLSDFLEGDVLTIPATLPVFSESESFDSITDFLNEIHSVSQGGYDIGVFVESQISASPDVLIGSSIPVTEKSNYFSVSYGDGINELSQVANPFAGNSPEIPLSALIPRAYEACYRSHFQDFQNEPFILDGEPQYNRYITNDGDGADTTDYKLFRRNWEADPFTSAKPSPQQGLAPIVGITEYGDVRLQKEDGTDYMARLETGDDGVINGYSIRKDGQISDQSVRRTLVELSTSGFTIERLRDVNAYQQWKEANIRRGLKFRDQVLSTFGVKLEYKELDMPEFLGGFSVPLNVDVINQTSSSVDNSPLGEIAGNGGFFGSSRHNMSKYADEEGIIMTLMCITPIPVYSQMLSRNWLRSNPLDYYNPQFGKIGNQPITYEEVCPVQAYNEGVDVHDVFGYQRPWYHMISSYDEVHGLMRNQMSGFVMQRVFGSTPELGADFLHIDESQMNEVFVVRDDEQDTFYGQILIDKKVKKGIPRFNVPSLT